MTYIFIPKYSTTSTLINLQIYFIYNIKIVRQIVRTGENASIYYYIILYFSMSVSVLLIENRK